MTVPIERDAAHGWRSLPAHVKRERVLEAAGRVFAEHGVDLPMTELAAAVGVGVGTLYRQFGTKEDVLAALVVAGAEALAERFERAAARDDAFAALREEVLETVRQALDDQVLQEAWLLAAGRPEVEAARARVRESFAALLARAKEQGTLREGVDARDLGLLLVSVRAAERVRPGGAERLTEYALEGMREPAARG